MCCACGQRYSTARYFKAEVQSCFLQVPPIDIQRLQEYSIENEEQYRASNISIDLFEEEMAPHLLVKSSNDLTGMISPKSMDLFLANSRLEALKKTGHDIDTAKNSMKEESESGFSSRSNMPDSYRQNDCKLQSAVQSKVNHASRLLAVSMKKSLSSIRDGTIGKRSKGQLNFSKSKPKEFRGSSTRLLDSACNADISNSIGIKACQEKKDSMKAPDKLVNGKDEDNSVDLTDKVRDSKKSTARDLYDSFFLDHKLNVDASAESLAGNQVRYSGLCSNKGHSARHSRSPESRTQTELKVQSALNHLENQYHLKKRSSDIDLKAFKLECELMRSKRIAGYSLSSQNKLKFIDLDSLKKQIEGRESVRNSHQLRNQKPLHLRTSDPAGRGCNLESFSQSGCLKLANYFYNHNDKISKTSEGVSQRQENKINAKNGESCLETLKRRTSSHHFSQEKEVINRQVDTSELINECRKFSFTSLKYMCREAQNAITGLSTRKRPSIKTPQTLHRRISSDPYQPSSSRSAFNTSYHLRADPGYHNPPNSASKDFSKNSHSISRMIDIIR